MIRLISLLLTAITGLGGGLMVWSRLAELPKDHAFCQWGLCGPGAATITSEPTNPFAWSDLAESKAAAGDINGARETFATSVRLGPNVPAVLIRVVNFEVANGELSRTVPILRHILQLTSVYDSVVFRYVVRSRMPLDRVLADVIPDPGEGSAEAAAKRQAAIASHAALPDGESRPRGEASRAWVSYLIADRHEDAAAAYQRLAKRGGVTTELRGQWIEYLVGVRKEYAAALSAWAEANKEEGYPNSNRIFDSRFERELSAGRMDWVLAAHPSVTTHRKNGLEFVFNGTDNLIYSHMTQQTYLNPGRWRFTAKADSEGLTTDKRPFFRISDAADPRRLDVSTPMAPDPMTLDFTVPPGGSWVAITLERRQSEKFDNKIDGTLRLRQVRLAMVNGGN